MCPSVDCFLPQSMVLGSGPAGLSLFVSSCWQLWQTATYVSGVDSLVSVRVWPPSGPADMLSFHWDRQMSASNKNKGWTCTLKFTMLQCHAFFCLFRSWQTEPWKNVWHLPILLCPMSPVSLKNVLECFWTIFLHFKILSGSLKRTILAASCYFQTSNSFCKPFWFRMRV